MRLEIKTGARGNTIRRITPQTPADVEALRAIAARAALQHTDTLAQRRQLSQGGARRAPGEVAR